MQCYDSNSLSRSLCRYFALSVYFVRLYISVFLSFIVFSVHALRVISSPFPLCFSFLSTDSSHSPQRTFHRAFLSSTIFYSILCFFFAQFSVSHTCLKVMRSVRRSYCTKKNSVRAKQNETEIAAKQSKHKHQH